jgi:Site-specific recombinase XerD
MAVYKDKERKTWYIRTRILKHDGTYKEITKRGFKTKADALQEEQLLKISKSSTSSFHSFKDIAYHHLDDSELRTKDSTYITKETDIRLHFIPFFGTKNIYSITAKDIREWQNWQLKTFNPTEQTFRGRQKRLSNIFNHAVAFFNLAKNPIHQVPYMKMTSDKIKKPREIVVYNIDEWKAFIEQVTNIKHHAILSLIFYTGLRKGEATVLQWSDIDFKKKTISITKTLTKKRGNPLAIGTPKTKGSIRIVSMPDTLVNVLKRYKEYHKQYLPNWKESFYICKNEIPLNASGITHFLNHWLKETSCKKLTVHDLRHSHATILLKNGVDVKRVSSRLGHDDVATTLNIYSHLFTNDDKEIADKIDELIK